MAKYKSGLRYSAVRETLVAKDQKEAIKEIRSNQRPIGVVGDQRATMYDKKSQDLPVESIVSGLDYEPSPVEKRRKEISLELADRNYNGRVIRKEVEDEENDISQLAEGDELLGLTEQDRSYAAWMADSEFDSREIIPETEEFDDDADIEKK